MIKQQELRNFHNLRDLMLKMKYACLETLKKSV